MRGHADRAYESFNKRFWMPDKGYLFDVVDGEDGNSSLCRPNQLFAISLDHPVLERSKWEPVMDVVQSRLLTPFGLRSLAPGEPDYKRTYFGDLRSRDAAYHQERSGMVDWSVGGRVACCIPKIVSAPAASTEVSRRWAVRARTIGDFDADAPYTPRGCIAQA